MQTERFDTVVIGAGQAGLVTGYHLQHEGRSFVILDADERVGDTWRRRYDSLRLFTPTWACGLDGMPFCTGKKIFCSAVRPYSLRV